MVLVMTFWIEGTLSNAVFMAFDSGAGGVEPPREFSLCLLGQEEVPAVPARLEGVGHAPVLAPPGTTWGPRENEIPEGMEDRGMRS